MSYTYTVSPLSKLVWLDEPALRRALGVAEHARVFTFTYEQAIPFQLHATPTDIERWWQVTQSAHIDQLVTATTWSESSAVIRTRDIYPAQEGALFNLLAYIDQCAEGGLASEFRARPLDVGGVDLELAREAQRRGFSVRFPQASMAPEFFLPFTANLILDVEDWRGGTARFGSLPALLRELGEVLGIIARADPEAAPAGLLDMKHDDALAAAFNAARIKHALAQFAVSENLPLWFSE